VSFLHFMNTGPGRVIRMGMGAALIAGGVRVGGGAGVALMAAGLLPLATGATGVCPISPLVGEPARACSTPRKRAQT
jgi:hypothetical protein